MAFDGYAWSYARREAETHGWDMWRMIEFYEAMRMGREPKQNAKKPPTREQMEKQIKRVEKANAALERAKIQEEKARIRWEKAKAKAGIVDDESND